MAISFHSLRLLVVGVGGVQICLFFKILVWGILLNIVLFLFSFLQIPGVGYVGLEFTDVRSPACNA